VGSNCKDSPLAELYSDTSLTPFVVDLEQSHTLALAH
jgi:hypothetical protein